VLASLYLGIFGRKFFYRWNRFLLLVAARGICVSDPMLKTLGPGEESFLRRFARLASPTVFDVGANVGQYSARLMELCPTARIWAFEPHPGTFKRLAEVAQRSKGVTAVNAGLGDLAGTADLFDYASLVDGAGSAHASLNRRVIEDLHQSTATSVVVDIRTIDEVISTEKVEQVNLLKIDAEGHELSVLKGAASAISSRMIDVVQFEFNEMNVISHVFLKDFYDALPGYAFYRMVVDGLAPLGRYQARTHELFFLHNVVAIRGGFNNSAMIV